MAIETNRRVDPSTLIALLNTRTYLNKQLDVIEGRLRLLRKDTGETTFNSDPVVQPLRNRVRHYMADPEDTLLYEVSSLARTDLSALVNPALTRH